MTEVGEVYKWSTLYSWKVVLYAFWGVYKNLLWPMSLVGLPMVIFGFEGSLHEQLTFFLMLTLMFSAPCLLLCLLLHFLSLKTESQKGDFYELPEKERGVLVGDELSGWW